MSLVNVRERELPLRARVLVVGSEPMILRALGTLLAARDFESVVVDDAAEGLVGGPFEAALVAGGPNGCLAVVERIKRSSPRTEVLMVAPPEGEAQIPDALRLGAFACVRRPLANLEDLAHLVGLAVERNRLVVELEALRAEKSRAPAPKAPALTPNDLLAHPFAEAKSHFVSAFEQAYVDAMLERTQGNISEAARRAGLDRSNFRRVMSRYRGGDNGPAT